MPEDEISTHGVSHLRSVQRDIQHMAEDDLSQPFSTPAQLAVQSYRTCVRSRLARTRMCDQAASGDDWISEKRLARLRRSNGECLCTVHRLANVPATAVPRRPWLRHGHVCVLWSGVARCGVVWRGVCGVIPWGEHAHTRSRFWLKAPTFATMESLMQMHEMVTDAPTLRAPTEAVKTNRSTLENW